MQTYDRSAKSRSEVLSVGATAALLLVVLMAMTSLIAFVIVSMVTSADSMDDARATRAARSAMTALESKIAGTVRDNAVWDEAYKAVNSADPAPWIDESWGAVSVDYPLYDGTAVTSADARIGLAWFKGQRVPVSSLFGPSLNEKISLAAVFGRDPDVSFALIKGEPFVVGVQAIQPSNEALKTDAPPKVLVFFKAVGPDVLTRISEEHSLSGLTLRDSPEPSLLFIPLLNSRGEAIKYLSWNPDKPGLVVYRQVRPYLLGAGLLLAVFMIGVVLIARVEARRLKRAARISRFLATHDALSGLLNRSGFFEALARLQDKLRADETVTVFLLDLDGFKAVNDTWGHPVGDRLITLVATALGTCDDQIEHAARLGGDEFAIIARGSARNALMVGNIMRIFGSAYDIDGRSVEVGVSIGFATGGPDVGANELMRRADLALYHAKESGKGRAVCFEDHLDQARLREAILESELRQAIGAGDIIPVFQPLFAADTREVTGVEALARWLRPEGPVSPEVFVPLAEKCGLIDLLGARLLEDAVRHARHWGQYMLSVNVSPLQLCNPSFAGQVKSILERHGFEPSRLTLEVTENILVANPDLARRSIEALKKAGVSFALDDFGCGYASIGMLRLFGFDRIKIDRSLVSAGEANESGLSVLKATVALARALDLPVTAEGIENSAQADMLETAGCDQLQGYLLGRPISAEQIEVGFKGGQHHGPNSLIA